MSQWASAYGPVRIVPAAELRRRVDADDPPSQRSQHPPPSSRPSTSRYIETDVDALPSYGDLRSHYAAHAYAGNLEEPPQRRRGDSTETPTTGTLNPTLRKYQRYKKPPTYQRYRPPAPTPLATTSASAFDSRYYQSFSGNKRPPPIYQKRRDPRPASYHYGWAGAPPSGYIPPSVNLGTPVAAPDYPPLVYEPTYGRGANSAHHSNPSLIRTNSGVVYTPSVPIYGYTTAAQRKRIQKRAKREYVEQTFPVCIRFGVKIGELLLGLTIIALIWSPARDANFADFLIRTQTEWQGVVMATVAVMIVTVSLLILTICCANRVALWRRIDVVNTAVSALLYLVVTCVEAYYAACYPPNGYRIALVCYRVEWIIAAALCFFQIVIYITDLIMSLRTGVSLL